MAIYPKATSELNIFNDDDGDATSPPDFMINSGTGQKISLGTELCSVSNFILDRFRWVSTHCLTLTSPFFSRFNG